MLDGVMRKLIDPPLNAVGKGMAAAGVGANTMTLFGLVIGVAAAVAIAASWHWLGLGLLIVSRLADGLDGAIARATQKTDFGGYLDIVADFMFYGVIPFGFILSDPGHNALAGAFLLVSYYVNGTTFLGYAILAEKHRMATDALGEKSLYFTEGLMEGSETIGLFIIVSIWPTVFPVFATVFALLTLVTAAGRTWHAYKLFGDKITSSDPVEPE